MNLKYEFNKSILNAYEFKESEWIHQSDEHKTQILTNLLNHYAYWTNLTPWMMVIIPGPCVWGTGTKIISKLEDWHERGKYGYWSI
jgi:hypothetical protein